MKVSEALLVLLPPSLFLSLCLSGMLLLLIYLIPPLKAIIFFPCISHVPFLPALLFYELTSFDLQMGYNMLCPHHNRGILRLRE